jgi:peroxisomal membrane protein 2
MHNCRFVSFLTHEPHPLTRTKGVLNFISEVLVRHFAGAPSKPLRKNASAWKRFLVWSKINAKAVKLALYGSLIAAPMSHFFVTTMHKAFAGRLRNGVQWHMIGTSMLLIAPIQIATYLTSLSFIENGQSKAAVKKTFKAAFVPALIVTCESSSLI